MANRDKMHLVDNWAGGVDLMVERDSGNMVRVMTGKPDYSLKFWHKLSELCNQAIDALDNGDTIGVIE